MITNVTANANYNNYNLCFKGVKDKFKSVAAKISTKIMPSPQEIRHTDATTKLAQRPTLRQELVNQAMLAYALAPKDGQKAAKRTIEFLTVPDRLRGLLNHYGYGDKLNELKSKLTFADDKERAIIKQEIRNLIDECASKNPSFDKAIKSLENIELNYPQEFVKLGFNPRKVDVIDDFLLWK